MLDLKGLDVESNAHLFDWMGTLIYGVESEPIATRKLEALDLKDVTDWRYREPSGSVALDRNRPDQSVSRISAREMRERLEPKPELRQSDSGDQNPSGFRIDSHTPDSFARPNAAAAFDLRQTQPIVENPLLAKWKIQGLSQNFYQQPEIESLSYLSGVQWVVDTLSQEVLNMRLLPPRVVLALGSVGAASVLYAHMAAKLPLEHLEAVVQQFQEKQVAPLKDELPDTLKRIGRECHLWADKGNCPVLSADGRVNPVLTIANIATAIVAIKKLRNMANAHYSYVQGANECLNAINMHVQPRSGDRPLQ